MLIVETVGRIRRKHLIKGKSIKELAREWKVFRNTIRKMLRSGEVVVFLRARGTATTRLGRWKADLDRLLSAIRR